MENLYTVQYFNPIGNCDCAVHVKASCPMEAAFIAHASTWTPQRKFEYSDYDVTEFDLEDFRTLESIKWEDANATAAVKQAMKEYVLEQWKWYYKTKHTLDDLVEDCQGQFKIERDEVEKILKEAGEL